MERKHGAVRDAARDRGRRLSPRPRIRPRLAIGCVVVAALGCAGGEEPPPDPYAAPPDAPYTAEEVTVLTPAGLSLAGTLTLPKAAPGAVPAVVTITGSGQQNRDEQLGAVRGYRPFRQIADTLGRRGIAVLRLDDRGVGGSDPGPGRSTSFDSADDIRAALSWLRGRPKIDADRLAILGHSEGGVIAPIVAASDSSLAGMVLLAGPAYTLRRVNLSQTRERLGSEGTLTPEQLDTEMERVARIADVQAERDAWRRAVWAYDPLPTAREVTVPVLLLHGETDLQITPEQADTLAAAFREGGNDDVTLRMFPETNHLFLADPDGSPGGYGRLSPAVRPEVLGAIADWLADRLEAAR